MGGVANLGLHPKLSYLALSGRGRAGVFGGLPGVSLAGGTPRANGLDRYAVLGAWKEFGNEGMLFAWRWGMWEDSIGGVEYPFA